MILLTTLPPDLPATTPPTPASSCPSSDWHVISSGGKPMCYLLRKNATNWFDARYDCTQQGRTGDLATVNNQYLDEQIIDHLIRQGLGPGGWDDQVCTIRMLLS